MLALCSKTLSIQPSWAELGNREGAQHSWELLAGLKKKSILPGLAPPRREIGVPSAGRNAYGDYYPEVGNGLHLRVSSWRRILLRLSLWHRGTCEGHGGRGYGSRRE